MPATMLSMLFVFVMVIIVGKNAEAQRNVRSGITSTASSNVSNASRSSGVAPLSVHFTAGFSASSPTERGFHDNDYSWNFGDSLSGSWGTDNKSKNEAKGPVTAHVFETPGSYTVTLTVRNASGIINIDTFNITVTDPDIVYSGTNTTCICDIANNDFTGCPVGATQVATDDISQIATYAGAGRRILLHRGSSWTSNGVNIPNNTGPMTIGAYGSCSNPDELGICSNAPHITLTEGSFCHLSNKQNWRISDIYFTGSADNVIGGAIGMQRILLLRLKVAGFNTPIVLSHWKNNADDLIDQIAFVENDISDANINCVYIGSERIALLGNRLYDAIGSHVLRVWQAYLGVISHNIISGASVESGTGRHALKLHGPSQTVLAAETGSALDNPTSYVVVSDNVFGTSGPWPVAIGPQDNASDERISDVIFEKNRIHSDYGTQSTTLVQASIHVWGRYFTLRNNIIDGTGSTSWFEGIVIEQRGIEPTPLGNEVYGNTIYRSDNGTSSQRGIVISAEANSTIARNNLVSFPNSRWAKTLIYDFSPDLVSSNNLLTDTPGLVDPDNTVPLSRDFNLQSNSAAIGAGTTVPVFDDFYGNTRPQGSAYDIGAYEYLSGDSDLSISTTSLPNATVDQPYSQTLSATGGISPYTWSISSANLPAGLSLNASTGIISGTPTAAETANFTIQVADSDSPVITDNQALSITVDVSGTTSVNTIDKNKLLKIIPNPARENIDILITDVQNDFEINIYSINGQKIFHVRIKGNNSEFLKKLDVSGYSKGIYIVEVRSEKLIITEKLVLE